MQEEPPGPGVRLESTDRWFVSIDYLASVYGVEPAQGYVKELFKNHPEKRAAWLDRCRYVGSLSLTELMSSSPPGASRTRDDWRD
jgi:hypothetical protein